MVSAIFHWFQLFYFYPESSLYIGQESDLTIACPKMAKQTLGWTLQIRDGRVSLNTGGFILPNL